MDQLVTLPNILTGLRFAMIPVLIVLFSIEQTITIGLVTCFVFVFAALTDLVDGYFARKYKSESTLGKLMDPLADKVLVATALIMLIPLGRIPAWVCLLTICPAATTTPVEAASPLKPVWWWLPDRWERSRVISSISGLPS